MNNDCKKTYLCYVQEECSYYRSLYNASDSLGKCLSKIEKLQDAFEESYGVEINKIKDDLQNAYNYFADVKNIVDNRMKTMETNAKNYDSLINTKCQAGKSIYSTTNIIKCQRVPGSVSECYIEVEWIYKSDGTFSVDDDGFAVLNTTGERVIRPPISTSVVVNEELKSVLNGNSTSSEQFKLYKNGTLKIVPTIRQGKI